MSVNGVEIPTESSFRPPFWLWAVCAVAIVIGVGGLSAAFVLSPRDGWIWLLVDFVIFVGVANGLLLWAATFRVAQTRWTPAVNRLGHSALFYTPVLFAVLIALIAGVRSYARWATHPVAGKEAWLNVPFMAAREIVCVALLWILCSLMVRWTLKADARVRDGGEITGRDQYRLTAVSTAAVIWYTITGSVISYDFIMSLSPEWVSTMFAPYFWITNLYMGMAVLILMAALLRRPLGVERFLGPPRFHDMGNLLLGFSLFSMGLFFAQYLTIWYENLPEETHFLIVRYDKGMWQWPAWAAFLIGYAIPFVLLQSVRLKKNAVLCSITAAIAVVGVALERYVLIVPSVSPARMLIYPAGVLSILAFMGVFVLAVCIFLMRYPPVSSANVALTRSDMKLEVLS